MIVGKNIKEEKIRVESVEKKKEKLIIRRKILDGK